MMNFQEILIFVKPDHFWTRISCIYFIFVLHYINKIDVWYCIVNIKFKWLSCRLFWLSSLPTSWYPKVLFSFIMLLNEIFGYFSHSFFWHVVHSWVCFLQIQSVSHTLSSLIISTFHVELWVCISCLACYILEFYVDFILALWHSSSLIPTILYL